MSYITVKTEVPLSHANIFAEDTLEQILQEFDPDLLEFAGFNEEEFLEGILQTKVFKQTLQEHIIRCGLCTEDRYLFDFDRVFESPEMKSLYDHFHKMKTLIYEVEIADREIEEIEDSIRRLVDNGYSVEKVC